ASTATPSGLTGPPTNTGSSRSVTGDNCGTASRTVASERRVRISPTTPSSLCAVTKTTARRKFGSRIDGDAIRNWPVSDSIPLSLPVGRETRQNPIRIERLPRIRLSVDEDEIAGARIHRQQRLRREVLVVALDQLVDLAEVPALRERSPLAGEKVAVAAALLAERAEGLRQLLLVQADLELDRAQSPHPRDRAAERRELGARVRPEVAQ